MGEVIPLNQPAVALHQVDFTFAGQQGDVHVLKDFSLQVRPGEFLSLIGPSGCGKSTVFRLVAGLLRPTRGAVTVSGQPVTGPKGHVALMPQRDLLLPWRTVLENALLFLEVQGVPRKEAETKARAMLELFGLNGFEHAYPSQLSGGMRQRVAFMRTALSGKQVLLLDEPFGALDALTRMEMHEWLLQVWEQLGTTILFITHDVEEAVLLSDRVVVMGRRGSFYSEERVIDLPRPRERRLLSDRQFVDHKARLLDLLFREKEAVR